MPQTTRLSFRRRRLPFFSLTHISYITTYTCNKTLVSIKKYEEITHNGYKRRVWLRLGPFSSLLPFLSCISSISIVSKNKKTETLVSIKNTKEKMKNTHILL